MNAIDGSRKISSPAAKWTGTVAAIVFFGAVSLQLAALAGSGAWERDEYDPEQLLTLLRQQGWDPAPQSIANSEEEHRAVLRLLSYSDAVYQRLKSENGNFDLLVTHWKPGAMPADKVAAHTPDACWLGAGWVLVDAKFPPELRNAGFSAPGIQYRLYAHGRRRIHTVFFHRVGGDIISYGTGLPVPLYQRMLAMPGSWIRTKREQYIVRLTSEHLWSAHTTDPRFLLLATELMRLGDRATIALVVRK